MPKKKQDSTKVILRNDLSEDAQRNTYIVKQKFKYDGTWYFPRDYWTPQGHANDTKIISSGLVGDTVWALRKRSEETIQEHKKLAKQKKQQHRRDSIRRNLTDEYTTAGIDDDIIAEQQGIADLDLPHQAKKALLDSEYNTIDAVVDNLDDPTPLLDLKGVGQKTIEKLISLFK
jgi:hypothetical protein